MNLKKFFSIKDINNILSFMKKDKKNKNNKINLVLLKKIGKANFNYMFSESVLKKFFQEQLTK